MIIIFIKRKSTYYSKRDFKCILLGIPWHRKGFPKTNIIIQKRKKRSMRLLYYMIVILMANGLSID
jgi:hypothetical protein